MKKYFPYRFHGIFGQILLLLVCFSLIIGFTFFQLMDRSYKESYRTALLKRGHTDIMEMHSSIESTLSEIRAQLEGLLYNNADYSAMLVSGSDPTTTTVLSVASSLKRVAEASDSITQMELILPYSDLTISSTMGTKNIEASSLEQWILDQDDSILLIGSDIYYCYRYPEGKTLGVMAVQVNPDVLLENVDQTGTIYIYTKDGSPVFSGYMNYPSEQSLMVNGSGTKLEDDGTLVFDTEEGAVMIWQDPSTSWQYVHWEADFSAVSTIPTFLKYAAIYGVFLFLILVAVCVVIVWRICLPLRKAIGGLMSGREDTLKHAESEIDILYEIAAEDEENRTRMKTVLHSIGDTISEKALHRLLCDNMWDEKGIREMLETVESPLLSAKALAVIEIHGWSRQNDTIADSAWEIFYVQLIGFCRKYFDNKENLQAVRVADRELCLVVFFPELRGESEWNHEVEGFGEWLQQRYQAMEFSTAIGWSGIAATIQDLPECRKQARDLLNKRLYYSAAGDSPVAQETVMGRCMREAEDILNAQMRRRGDSNEEDQLARVRSMYESVTDGQRQELAQVLLNVLVERLIQFHVSVPECVDELRQTLGRRGEEEISVEVLEKKLEEAYQSGLDAIQSQGKKEKYAYIDKAKQLIAENYYDSGLSLDMLGQMLGVSPQYLSKLFKEYQAPGFLDYLNRYRLKQAKRLLDETTLMVGEIGEKTGFGSSQSFIRVFKKYEKETPGQYRARQKEDTYE